MESINKKGIIKNSIVALIFGILIPLSFNFFMGLIPILPLQDFINPEAIIMNGIIFSIVYICFGLFKKDSLIRFFIGIAYIIVLIYFFTVGYTIFTLYLPMCSFGVFCIHLELEGMAGYFSINTSFFIIISLVLKGLNLVRHLFKPSKEEKKEHKSKKSKD